MKRKSNRILALLMVITMVLSMSDITFAGTTTSETATTVTIASVKDVEPGSSVDVTVDVKNNPGILGGTMKLEYDSNLTLSGVKEGDAFSALTLTKPGKLTSPCNFLWDGMELSEEDIKDGTVITLTFDVAETAKSGAVLPVKATFADVIDNDLNEIAIAVTNGSVTAKSSTSEEKTTEDVTVEDPTTEEKTTEDVTVEDPTTEEKTTEDVTTENPTTEEPGGETQKELELYSIYVDKGQKVYNVGDTVDLSDLCVMGKFFDVEEGNTYIRELKTTEYTTNLDSLKLGKEEGDFELVVTAKGYDEVSDGVFLDVYEIDDTVEEPEIWKLSIGVRKPVCYAGDSLKDEDIKVYAVDTSNKVRELAPEEYILDKTNIDFSKVEGGYIKVTLKSDAEVNCIEYVDVLEKPADADTIFGGSESEKPEQPSTEDTTEQPSTEDPDVEKPTTDIKLSVKVEGDKINFSWNAPNKNACYGIAYGLVEVDLDLAESYDKYEAAWLTPTGDTMTYSCSTAIYKDQPDGVWFRVVMKEGNCEGPVVARSKAVKVTDFGKEQSTTQTPSTQKPTDQPTTQAPSTEKPAQQPTTQTPGTEKPVQKPTTPSTNVTPNTYPSISTPKPEKLYGVKLKNKKSKKLSISWSEPSEFYETYEVQIATKRNFKKGLKKKYAFMNSVTFTKLKKGKTYYVRVRAWSDDEQSGPWSSVKKIKIKK